jgi:hypothetical protein
VLVLDCREIKLAGSLQKGATDSNMKPLARRLIAAQNVRDVAAINAGDPGDFRRHAVGLANSDDGSRPQFPCRSACVRLLHLSRVNFGDPFTDGKLPLASCRCQGESLCL